MNTLQMNRKIIVCIPALNEEKTIGSVIRSIPRTIGDFSVEVLVVDDGSHDATVAVAREAWVDHIVSHQTNQWVGEAFKSAADFFLWTHAEILVNIDADGQFPADRIPDLVAPIISGEQEIMIWSRFSGQEADWIPWFKRTLNKIIAWLIGKMMGKKIDDLTCWFRAYSREALLRLYIHSSFTYTQEVIIDAISKWLRIAWIPVAVKYFPERTSRVVKSVYKYVSKSLMIIFRTVRDAKPLTFFGIPWLVLFFLGIVFLLVFLIQYLSTRSTTPFRMWLYLGWFMLSFWFLLIIFASIADMIKRQRSITEENLYYNRRTYFDKGDIV